ncbi:MAG: ribosome maturation factor RimM [Dehalococcoidia bacterium]
MSLSSENVSREYVAVGRIVGPWGLRGDLKVEPLTDFPERFAPGSRLYVEGVAYTVERCRWQKGRLYVKLSGIDSAAAAEGLRERFLEVPEEELKPLSEGEYYQFQIVGLTVRTTTGQALGRVTEILSTGSNDVFVVKGEGGEVLIPALAEVIKTIDLDGGWMEVEPVEGLLPSARKGGGAVG